MNGLVVLWCLILVASLPVMVEFFMPPMPTWAERVRNPQVVVVLGAGRMRAQRGYEVAARGWRRATVAMTVADSLGLPVLFSGGPDEEKQSEAYLMADAVSANWPEATVWLEENSLNTWQNARHCADVLARKNINRVLLVTDRSHLPRALYCFRAQGLWVEPLSSTYFPRPSWMPSAKSLSLMFEAFYEWVALCWYWLKYR